jgi:hypothetical protein
MKISFSIGGSTFDFDGTAEEFVEHGEGIADALVDLGKLPPKGPTATSGAQAVQPPAAKPLMTAKAVATALTANTGPDLVYAAAAFLTVVEGMESFHRSTLLETMKSAVGFYKPTYGGNLTKYIDGWSKKGVLIEISNMTYAVKGSAVDEMTSKISN